MSKIIPITMTIDSEDFLSSPRSLDLNPQDIFTGVLSIAARVGILSNPTIPPIDVDIDVDSQDDHGLTSSYTFEDGDGNSHTLAVTMTTKDIMVVVTDDQGEVESDISVELKVRLEVESPMPKPKESVEEDKVDPTPHVFANKHEESTVEKKDLRDFTVRQNTASSKMLDTSGTIYVLGQDDLIYIVGMDGDELDHELCRSKLAAQWRVENLGNLDVEDRKMINDDEVTLLPFEVAVDIQDRLIDILERTYGIPVLTAVSRGHTYYLPLVDRDGKPHDPSLIACLNWQLWTTSKNVLADHLSRLLHTENATVLTMKQALIKQQHI